MGTTLLVAMDDGIDNELDPGEPEERNIYDAIKEGKQVKKLPVSLGKVLETLEKNKAVKRGRPGEIYRLFQNINTANGRGLCPPQPNGTTTTIWNVCPEPFGFGGWCQVFMGCEDDYGKAMFAREEFGRMADQLSNIEGRFIMSINDKEEIREGFANFNITEVSTTYSIGTVKGKNGGNAELLISNFQWNNGQA